MPWTPAQIRLFQAAAHNPAIATSHGLTQPKAREMASEGTRAPRKPSPQAYAKALSRQLA